MASSWTSFSNCAMRDTATAASTAKDEPRCLVAGRLVILRHVRLRRGVAQPLVIRPRCEWRLTRCELPVTHLRLLIRVPLLLVEKDLIRVESTVVAEAELAVIFVAGENSHLHDHVDQLRLRDGGKLVTKRLASP